MSQIKWFSGGNERKAAALSLIVTIQEELTENTVGERKLKALLSRFYNDLMSGTQSVPLTLSRLNISVADCLLQYHVVLSADNAERMEKLTKLSQIRYGY
ncbi:bacteriocin immunity protein [Vagococcus vulneris]|uniref:Bacteriocin immunity protein n=1 Tax=Vagococcus vulneris TaxID=1977869 RepID=A0A429ZXK3_9ENTE|nr:bacteriocin immunity protein [Vagococcus vulneris]RST98607.1 hypothetical protein CBF37_07470 [Vagococcus vulneris]